MDSDRFWLLTLRPRRGSNEDVGAMAAELTRLDLWPTGPGQTDGLAPGDLVLLHASGVGIVGDAQIDRPWFRWSDAERALLAESGHTRGDDPDLGGVSLLGARLWRLPVDSHCLTAFDHRLVPRATNDVERLSAEDWIAVQQERSLGGEPWRPEVDPVEWDDLGWIVVEDLSDVSAQIELTRWPRHVGEGIVEFLADSLVAAIDRSDLEEVWPQAGGTAAEPYVGAVLAAPCRWKDVHRLLLRVQRDPVTDALGTRLSHLVRGPARDVTGVARRLAQSSFYAAVTRTVLEPDDPYLYDRDE